MVLVLMFSDPSKHVLYGIASFVSFDMNTFNVIFMFII